MNHIRKLVEITMDLRKLEQRRDASITSLKARYHQKQQMESKLQYLSCDIEDDERLLKELLKEIRTLKGQFNANDVHLILEHAREKEGD